MEKTMSNLFEEPIKKYQIMFWLIALIAVLVSQIVKTTWISAGLLVAGLTVFTTTILTPLICPIYDYSYNFSVGTFVGMLVSFAPAILLKEMHPSKLWTLILLFGWVSGGYLSITDQIKSDDDLLNNPIATGLAIVPILLAFMVGLIIFSIIPSLIFSMPYLYDVIISGIIINIFLVEYLSKKIFSERLDKTRARPNSVGIFGSFLGALNGLIWFLIVRYFSQELGNISMGNFVLYSYPGLIAGVLVGYILGYRLKDISFS